MFEQQGEMENDVVMGNMIRGAPTTWHLGEKKKKVKGLGSACAHIATPGWVNIANVPLGTFLDVCQKLIQIFLMLIRIFFSAVKNLVDTNWKGSEHSM